MNRCQLSRALLAGGIGLPITRRGITSAIAADVAASTATASEEPRNIVVNGRAASAA